MVIGVFTRTARTGVVGGGGDAERAAPALASSDANASRIDLTTGDREDRLIGNDRERRPASARNVQTNIDAAHLCLCAGEMQDLRGVDVFTVRDGKVAEKLAYVKG
jgi:hypothetical protein